MIKKLIKSSFPVLFLTFIYGLVELILLDLIIYGDGDRTPISIPLRDLIIYHFIVSPVIFYTIIFILYKAFSRISTMQILIIITSFLVILEVWIYWGLNYVSNRLTIF